MSDKLKSAAKKRISRFSPEGIAQQKAGARYMKTVGEASEKANQTMTFSGKADFMKKIRQEAKKRYDLDIFFEGGK